MAPGPGAGAPGPDPGVAARVRAGRLLDGLLTTQLLYVAAKLGVADVLAGGPGPGPRSPRRSGRTRICSPGCCAGWPWRTRWRRWAGGGSRSPRSGRASGRRLPGRCGGRFFDYLARHPEQEAVFQASMLVLLGARERTEARYRGLLAGTGFRVARVVPTASTAGLSVIEALPAD